MSVKKLKVETPFIFNFDNLPKPALMIILSYIRKRKDKITTLLISKYIYNFALMCVWHPWPDGLLLACKKGYTEYYIKWSKIAGTRWDPGYDDDTAIIYACKKGHTEIAKILLEDGRADPSADNDVAIIYASSKGRSEERRVGKECRL